MIEIPGVSKDEMRRLEELSKQMLLNIKNDRRFLNKGEKKILAPTPTEVKSTME